MFTRESIRTINLEGEDLDLLQARPQNEAEAALNELWLLAKATFAPIKLTPEEAVQARQRREARARSRALAEADKAIKKRFWGDL